MIRLLTHYILKAAAKDKLLLLFLILAAVVACLSIFLGSSAITEKDQFSLVFMASALRLGGVITLILFIIFYLRRSFESHDLEFLLTRPISRLQFLMAHILAFSILATVLVALIMLALAMIPTAGGYGTAYFLWSFSIWIEFLIVANVALFFGLFLSSAMAASLSCLAFYVLARMIGGILGIIQYEADESTVIKMVEKLMLLISVFVPRLDLVGKTSWLVYEGSLATLGFFMLQAFVFCGLLASASWFELRRRQF
jgi:hypothetical protein